MSTIGTYIKLDGDAEFRSDVQIDAYEKPHNLGLLKSYLFTSTPPAGNLFASLGILDSIIDAFINSRLENRMVVIANYGHGKSHLALALANFFGKPTKSDEVNVLFGKIKDAVKDQAQAERYFQFKKSKGKFMVFRLRGDIPGGIRSQFIRELEKIVDSNPETRGTEMHFWFTQAQKYLSELTPDQTEKANEYLRSQGTELSKVLEQVTKRRLEVQNLRDLCKEALRQGYGVPVSLEDEISLKMMVNWAAEKLCGDGKPFSGILFLFDEFSLYLANHVAKSTPNELQDLLNGVDDQRQKVVFIAFSQHDPINYVRTIMAPGMMLESVQRELGRLPKKLQLYSLMESVIDTYLSQKEDLWNILLNDSTKGPFTNACDITFDTFSKRYKQVLRWEYKDFRETVAKGCFPLHPMTTALLCNVNFQNLSGQRDPRTVLGFVLDQLHSRQNQELIINDRINWILPIDLVDFFDEQLASESFKLYSNARRMVTGMPEEYAAVLKALLLHDVAELKGSYNDQISQLATMAGLEENTFKGIARDLVEKHVIRQDPFSRRLLFWSGGIDPDEFERLVQQKLQSVSINSEIISKLGTSYLENVPPNGIKWGKPDDWSARSVLIQADDFTVENVQKELSSYHTGKNNILEGDRGIVFWLLARGRVAFDSLTGLVSNVLNQAVSGGSPLPIVAVLPRDESPSLFKALEREKALQNFTTPEKETYKDIHTQELAQTQATILREMRAISYDRHTYQVQRPQDRYITTSSYNRALINADQKSISVVLGACYNLAYQSGPGEFYTQYSWDNVNVRNAIKLTSKVLLENTVSNLRAMFSTYPVVEQIVMKILVERWGVLNASTLRIQPPTNSHPKVAWDLLDQTFIPKNGDIDVKPVLLTLLNPPFGYDYNSLTLLFSAWFGYNAKDLQITIGISKKSISDVINLVNGNNPKDFITKTCVSERLYLSRQDISEFEKRVQNIQKTYDEGNLTIPQAEEFLPDLDKYASDERYDDSRRATVRTIRDELSRSITIAKEYEGKASTIKGQIAKINEIERFFSIQEEIRALPNCQVVFPSAPKKVEFLTQVDERLRKYIDTACQDAEDLDNLRNYGLFKTRLETLQKLLKQQHLTELSDQVTRAIVNLNNRLKELERKSDEKAVLDQIAYMDERAPLVQLRTYAAKLESMLGYAPHIENARSSKLQQISEQIGTIEANTKRIISSISNLTEDSELESWFHRYSNYLVKVEGSELESELKQSYSAYQLIRNTKNELRKIESSQLRSPADVDSFNETIRQLEEKLDSVMFNSICNLIIQSRGTITRRVAKLSDQAEKEIDRIISEFQSGKLTPSRALAQMDTPPAFLPKESRGRWDQLKSQIIKKMNQDIVSDVIDRFSQISDPSLQEECIHRLEKLIKNKVA